MSSEKSRRLVSDALTLSSLAYVPVAELLQLTNAIDAAFEEVAREQRERDAKIAETSPPHVAHTYSSENAEQYRAFDDGQRFGANLIAAALRDQKETP